MSDISTTPCSCWLDASWAGALLDHIAEELAREYVRLMKTAADDEGVGLGDPSREAA